MGDLDGRVAVVTGGARGIGAAEAIQLGAEGAKVAVLDLMEDECRDTVKEIEDNGSEALAVAADVSNTERVREAFEKVADRFGKIDILVNNAGLTRDGMAFKMPEKDWDLVMDVHLKGSFLCSQAAQKYMSQQQWGRIIMTSSIGALGQRGQANYSSAKAGLEALTRVLSMELGRFNITVNAVAPGWTDTEMTRDMADRLGMSFDELQERYSKNIPLRRFGTVGDIANVVAFLCSEKAAYVSGQTIYIAGGPAHVVV